MKNSIIFLIFVLIFQVSCKEKEVLSSFTVMNSKIEESIENSSITNSTLLDVIFNKAKNDDDFITYKQSASKVHEISNIFTAYLGDLKSVIKEKNSTKFVDEYFFNGSEIANGGDEFLNYIENYKSSIISTVILSNPDIAGMVKSTFDISAIEDRKGKQTDWLTLNYQGFPAIASVIKLSEMQADVKQIEQNFHEAILNVKINKSRNTNKDLLINKKNKIASNNTQTKIETNKEEKTVVKKVPKKEIEEIKSEKVKEEKVKEKTVLTVNSASSHVVLQGETLYMISKKYGLTTVLLKKLNGMTNNNLVIGQKLKLN